MKYVLVVLQRCSWWVCVLGLLASGTAFAGTCRFADTNPVGNRGVVVTMPLSGGSLTVGRDVPLGAEVYRQTFFPATNINVTCIDIVPYAIERNFFTRTPLRLSSWNSGVYAGKVYESGVPGIGIVLVHSSDVVPYDWNWRNCSGAVGNCNVNLGPSTTSYTVLFIKIGPVSAGVINGSNLPSVARDLVSDNTIDPVRLNFSGSINIVSSTCTTPDVPVVMGTHQLSEFSGKNSFTPWKDFSIGLNNCPAFNGYYQSSGPTWTSNGGAGSVGNLDSRKNNVLRVRLDPTTAAINPSQGILSINPSRPGDTPAATGVGLQVAESNGTPLPLATLRASGITPRADAGASYSIPLKARYIQTEDRITAGPADATAWFTIDYY
ncbi:fimbrial protein [Pseudomonas costantinii]|uniref:fimbrial protein n=1 Tax=Pseudomonas costantinii TaxID=168469 RepID=UPI0015A28906|nr:fimbrial protein [Pseudomonas costantinii]NVZ69504.1 type 1 fimbrial protein [Pseudomonas costantinii]